MRRRRNKARHIFDQYLRLRPVFDLYDYLKENGYRSKRRVRADGEAEVARSSPEGPYTTSSAIQSMSERLDMEGNSTKGSTKQS